MEMLMFLRAKMLLFLQEQEVVGEFEHASDKFLNKVLEWKVKLFEHLPEIILSILVFVASYTLSVFIRRLVGKPLKRFIKRDSIRTLISTLISIIIISLGLLLALSILDLTEMLTGILGAAGIAGLAVGLALQGTLANAVSGVFLSVNDIMNVGDFVVTNGFQGNVEEISLRNTKIRELDNNIVIIPNTAIVDKPFKNYALTQRMRTTIKCGVHYKSDLPTVKKVVMEAIAERFPQLDYERVEFQYLEFGDSAINFQVRFWIEATTSMTILEANSEAIMIIHQTLKDNHITIPFPIRTLDFENQSIKVKLAKD